MSTDPGDEHEGRGPLEVDVEVRAARLARRVDALERQLQVRIDQVDDLRRQLAHLRRGRDQGEMDRLEHKAAEYDALMNTIAWRTLRRPREWYGAIRRRMAKPDS